MTESGRVIFVNTPLGRALTIGGAIYAACGTQLVDFFETLLSPATPPIIPEIPETEPSELPSTEVPPIGVFSEGSEEGAPKSLPNTGRWGGGSYDSALDSLNDHFLRHGAEVGAADAAQYLRKAEEFARNLRGAMKSSVPGATPDVTRYKKSGRYIDIDSNGNIISFGKQ